MIILRKRIWSYTRDKLIFFAPILTVIAMSTVLVYCTYLAEFKITAAVIAEEGTGTEAASAGLVNALTLILPAIIGGFGIALLFKYRKKLTLKFFFGGALCFAGAFIAFFFGDSILFLIQSKFYGLYVLNFDPYNIELFNLAPLITFDGVYYIMIIFCCGFSFWTALIISSRRFTKKTKNYALLFQSALMGAFLSVILPTYTVVILLIGLSIYDIYSVRRGPIKDIVKYSLENERKNYPPHNNPAISGPKANSSTPNCFGYFLSIKISLGNELNKSPNLNHRKNNNTTSYRGNTSKSIDDVDESETILTNMTYSTRDWDIGIGDLVFYSMLASQPLTPYFISNHGAYLLESFGLWIFWVICLCTVIGILIGFLITIRLLESNSMLPGLPLSIALGLTGFLGSALIISFL